MSYLLLRASTTVLVHASGRRAMWKALYVDANGEADPHLQRGKMLYLSEARLRAACRGAT